MIKLSVIANSVASVAEEITQFLDQVKIRLISQLIKDILRAIQKLIKYFNGTDTSKYFVLRSSGIFPVTLILDLNDSDSVILSFDSSLNIALNFLMFLNNHHCILLNFTLASQHLYTLHYLFE